MIDFINIMDFLYQNSLSTISLVQQSFQEQRYIMFALSNIFDPRYAFLIYAPLFYAFNKNIGKKMMWATVMAEWSNHVLKLLIHGERPYWWVHEFSERLNNQGKNSSTLPKIQQTFMTCETGPGSPSGHAMITACVWYVIISGLLKSYQQQKQQPKQQNNAGNVVSSSTTTKYETSSMLLSKICWSFYTLALCGVSLSRIYIAAHFPHQCILGSLIGISVARMVDSMIIDDEDYDDSEDNANNNANNNKKRLPQFGLATYIFGTIGMMTVALSSYGLLLAFGFNPSWSVERALKWCSKPENIHLDTTPFFSMMRYSGFFLGMGIGLNSKFFISYKKSLEFGFFARFLIASLSLIVAKFIENFPMDKSSLSNLQLYTIVFLLNVLLPYLFISIIPSIVYNLRRILFGIPNKIHIKSQ